MIAAINYEEGLILLDTGIMIEIYCLFDGEGDETESVEEAAAFMAQLPDGRWIEGSVNSFESVKIN